jgi:hypothetical protein
MVREFAFSSTGSVSLRGFAAVGFAAIATFLGFTGVILIAVVVLALCRGLSFAHQRPSKASAFSGLMLTDMRAAPTNKIERAIFQSPYRY